jgi:hypothetical protein
MARCGVLATKIGLSAHYLITAVLVAIYVMRATCMVPRVGNSKLGPQQSPFVYRQSQSYGNC